MLNKSHIVHSASGVVGVIGIKHSGYPYSEEFDEPNKAWHNSM